MSELKEKIISTMKQHTLAALATVTADNQPWTRYVVVRADDQMDIWFATFKGSRKVAQIVRNPEVHLVLGVTDMKSAVSWIQVQGKAEILEDHQSKKAVWYDMLEPVFKGPEDPSYVVCKVRPYRIEYYTMNKRKPEIWEA